MFEESFCNYVNEVMIDSWRWFGFAVQPLPKGDQVLNFSDAEQMVDDVKLK